MMEKEKNEGENLEDTRTQESRENMLRIKNNMPAVWQMIMKSNCCPHDLELSDSCGFNRNCEDCWIHAINSSLGKRVDISKDGQYLCTACEKKLEFDQITLKGRQRWHCPKCKTVFEISLSDTNLSRVTVIDPNE